MSFIGDKDKLSLSVASLKIVSSLLEENSEFAMLIKNSASYEIMMSKLKKWITTLINNNPNVRTFLKHDGLDREHFDKLQWRDYALVRLSDYYENEGKIFQDLNSKEGESVSQPFYDIWLASKFGKGTADESFFSDMLMLMRQLSGRLKLRKPGRKDVQKWMSLHSCGLEEDVELLRQANKDRIIKTIIAKLDSGELKSQRFKFETGLNYKEKYKTVFKW